MCQHLGAHWRCAGLTLRLSLKLRELEDKYAECMEMLHEAQEELKNLRNKTMPTSRRYHSLGLFPMVSGFSCAPLSPRPLSAISTRGSCPFLTPGPSLPVSCVFKVCTRTCQLAAS